LLKAKKTRLLSNWARDKAKVQHDLQKLSELREYAGQYESERNLLGLSAYLTTNYQHFVDRVRQAIVSARIRCWAI